MTDEILAGKLIFIRMFALKCLISAINRFSIRILQYAFRT